VNTAAKQYHSGSKLAQKSVLVGLTRFLYEKKEDDYKIRLFQ